MTETIAQWEQRCREQKVACPVCGKLPDSWCVEFHLPYANERCKALRDETEEYVRATFTYTLAWQQRPTQKESTMILGDDEDDSAFQPAEPPAAPPTEVDGPTTAVPPEPGSDGSGPTFIQNPDFSGEPPAELSSDRGRTFVSEPDGLPGQGFEGALPGELAEKAASDAGALYAVGDPVIYLGKPCKVHPEVTEGDLSQGPART